ncbi:MAG: acetyl-CoA acetyltransferase, partial [Candidatus Krumholzibacteria bacterium]|nr:acetyl-CoA acetyltransferase [Candidatus Krumholzibacteria bacterium]
MPSKRLKDQVCVVGIGCTAFGEHFDSSYEDLVAEAAVAAMRDAGVSKKQIDAAWLGTAFPDAGVYKGRAGMDLAEPLGLFNIPVTRVSN